MSKRLFKRIQDYIKKEFDGRIFIIFLLCVILSVFLFCWACFLEKYVTTEYLKIFKWSIAKDIVTTLLNQFAGTFLIIAILTITVESLFRKFLKQDIDLYRIRISENVYDAIFGNFVPDEILSEIKQQIILSAFIYRNYNAEYTFDSMTKINGEDYIKFSSEIVYTIENISELERTFNGEIEYTNYEFEGDGNPVEHEMLEIRYKNKEILSFNEAQCKKLVQQSKEEKATYLLPYEVKIAGEDNVELRLNRSIYLKSNNDSITIFVKRPTINMNVKILFPSDKYDLSYYACLPGTKKSFKREDRHHKKEVNLTYEGGILPYQGVEIEWKKRHV